MVTIELRVPCQKDCLGVYIGVTGLSFLGFGFKVSAVLSLGSGCSSVCWVWGSREWSLALTSGAMHP